MYPKLSICIPTYNRAELLKRQLRSLALALSDIPPKNYEIVFRDNASSDETPHVIQEFSQKFPVKMARNSENIGLVRNILTVPLEATGEFVWLLGDDDLVLPGALEKIFKSFDEYPEVKGHIVSHAIEWEENRDISESAILNGVAISDLRCLIKTDTNENFLERFEEVFKLTDFSAAFNFLSNIIFLRKDWLDRHAPYLAHCESHDEFSDEITAGGLTCFWAEVLVGKPVAVINTPLLIGFLGRQAFLSKWPVICWVFFLDISQWYLKFGADLECVRIYQRAIYRDSSTLGRIALSDDEYSRKYFSLKSLITKYGDDEFLWESLYNALISVKGMKAKLDFLCKAGLAVLHAPRHWGLVVNIISRRIVKSAQSLFKSKLAERTEGYSGYLDDLSRQATDYFRSSVTGGADASVSHPLYLKNQQYLYVGQRFFAGPGLRIEAWDHYRGQSYSPKIKIGDRVCFNFNCHVGVINSVKIGNDVLIGSNVLITDHQHGDLDRLVKEKTFAEQLLNSKGPVVIGDNVWIGENVCILPNVEIGENSIIGANSVVTKSFPRNSVICGMPAIKIRELEI